MLDETLSVIFKHRASGSIIDTDKATESYDNDDNKLESFAWSWQLLIDQLSSSKAGGKANRQSISVYTHYLLDCRWP